MDSELASPGYQATSSQPGLSPPFFSTASLLCWFRVGSLLVPFLECSLYMGISSSSRLSSPQQKNRGAFSGLPHGCPWATCPHMSQLLWSEEVLGPTRITWIDTTRDQAPSGVMKEVLSECEQTVARHAESEMALPSK